MHLRLISCEVLYREMCHLEAHSPNQVDVSFLPKGLHDMASAAMRRRLQQEVDTASETGCDAVILGYALCGMGLSWLAARNIPLVLPRAHDCIALFMGSRHRYRDYFETHPGVYFKTSGWIERGQTSNQLTGAGLTLEALAAKYGEENALYLYEELNHYSTN